MVDRRHAAGWLALLLFFGVALAEAPAFAQPASVVRALQRYGRVDRRDAAQIAREAHDALVANARQGGASYDPLRQHAGTAMFGGPGQSRAEYDARLQQVISRLQAGLSEDNLRVLFAPGDGATLRCARILQLSMAACDALIATAAQQESDFPYLAPEDGSELVADLVRGGADRAQANEIAAAVRRVMLSVPSAVDTSARGRRLGALLNACPGGLPDEDSRVRVWHLGPTPGVARCIGQSVGRDGRSAPATLLDIFGLGAPGVAFLQWAHGQPVRAEVALAPTAPPPGASRNTLMSQAVTFYQANRFMDAARTYQQVTQLEPSFSGAHQGMAVSLMRAGDPSGAAQAYRVAARLEPTNAGIQVGLARALTQLGDRAGAAAAYQMALTLEPRRQDARGELAQLMGAGAPPPPRPTAPPPTPVDPIQALREQARAHFNARRFGEAATAYHSLTQRIPTDASAWAGVGASELARRNARGAVEAYRLATQLDPQNANFFVALAAAESTAGNTDAARTALEAALALDPANRGAQEGMRHVGPPRPTLPATPARADIVRTLVPFQERLEACAPRISGSVRFRIVIRGADGAVSEVALQGPHADSAEGECMVGHLRGARFPRFSQEVLSLVYPFELVGEPAAAEAPPPPPPDEGEPPLHVDDLIGD